jgi:hypothetical protein
VIGGEHALFVPDIYKVLKGGRVSTRAIVRSRIATWTSGNDKAVARPTGLKLRGAARLAEVIQGVSFKDGVREDQEKVAA